jgi:hypothetical protein
MSCNDAPSEIKPFPFDPLDALEFHHERTDGAQTSTKSLLDGVQCVTSCLIETSGPTSFTRGSLPYVDSGEHSSGEHVGDKRSQRELVLKTRPTVQPSKRIPQHRSRWSKKEGESDWMSPGVRSEEI